jgi:hypothetical protein
VAWYDTGLVGAIGAPLVEAGAKVLGVETSKQKRLRREAASKRKSDKGLFGANLAANKEADERMSRLSGDMQAKMSAAPGASQRAAAEAGAMGMGRANISGPGSIAAFRDVGIKGHDALARGEADLATANMAMERGKQTDDQQSAIDVNNALNAARQAGALNQESIARIAGMARGDAAKRMIEHAEATYKAPKKSSFSGDVGNVLGYLTT